MVNIVFRVFIGWAASIKFIVTVPLRNFAPIIIQSNRGGNSMVLFGDRLAKAILEKQNPTVVGVDPTLVDPKREDRLKKGEIPNEVPRHIQEDSWTTNTFPEDAGAQALMDFGIGLVNGIKDDIPAIKPQGAFFERFGPAGEEAYREVCNTGRKVGLIVISDKKRNDIGNTFEAYMEGIIGRSTAPWEAGAEEQDTFAALDVDAVTVNPYLGIDGVRPAFQYFEGGKGIFVLVRTSNKSAGEFQDRLVRMTPEEYRLVTERLEEVGLNLYDMKVFEGEPDAEELRLAPAYIIMALNVDRWGQEFIGESGMSSVGAVVGATYPEEAAYLRAIMPNTPFLVPGYGAQGGGAEDAKHSFWPVDAKVWNTDSKLWKKSEGGVWVPSAIVNSSRKVNFAYANKPHCEKYGPEDYVKASVDEVLAMKKDLVGTMLEDGRWVA
jgi:orotidine-5'-phosphate decarboxylase